MSDLALTVEAWLERQPAEGAGVVSRYPWLIYQGQLAGAFIYAGPTSPKHPVAFPGTPAGDKAIELGATPFILAGWEGLAQLYVLRKPYLDDSRAHIFAHLLDAGADPNAVLLPTDGDPPGDSWCYSGLIGWWAGEAPAWAKRTPLVPATFVALSYGTAGGMLRLLQSFVAAGGDLTQPVGQWDRYPVELGLWLLGGKISPATTREALEAGLFDPCRTDRYGRTALFFAPTPEIYRLFVEAGADPDARAELPRGELALLRMRGKTPPYWHGKTAREVNAYAAEGI